MKRKGFYSLISMGMLCLLLIGLLSAPQPAQAYCGCRCYPGFCPGDIVYDPIKWAINQARSLVKMAISKFSEYQYLMTEYAFKDAGAANTQLAELRMLIKTKIANARSNHDYLNSRAAAAAEIAAKRRRNDRATQLMCQNIQSDKISAVMDGFAQATSAKVLSSLLLAGQGQGADYDGPRYVWRDNALRCGINPGDPKTGSSWDGGDPSCVGKPQFVKANVSFLTLTRDVSTLQVPRLVTKTKQTASGPVSVKIAEAQNEEQQMFIAAVDVCTRVMGPRPTPPWGKALDSAEGRHKRVVFDGCLTRQAPLLQPCTDRVGYLARPNCDDPKSKPYCDIAKTMCAAAEKAGVALSPDYKNCEQGLSDYEMEKLSIEICFGANKYYEAEADGTRATSLDAYHQGCAKLKALWQRKLQKSDIALANTMKPLQQMKSCFIAAR